MVQGWKCTNKNIGYGNLATIVDTLNQWRIQDYGEGVPGMSMSNQITLATDQSCCQCHGTILSTEQCY